MTILLTFLARNIASDQYPIELLDGFVTEETLRLARPVDKQYEDLRNESDLRIFLDGCLKTLPAKSASLLRRRFGLGCRIETLTEIAADLGCSAQWVKTLEIAALRRLRRSPVVRAIDETGLREPDPRMTIQCSWKSAQGIAEITLSALRPHWPMAMSALDKAAAQIRCELGDVDLLDRRRRLVEIVHRNLEWEIPRIRAGHRFVDDLFHLTFAGPRPFALGRKIAARVEAATLP